MTKELTLIQALSDVVQRVTRTSASLHVETVEVERLYLMGEEWNTFTQKALTAGFRQGDDVSQEDEFHDLQCGNKYLLSEWDYYLRIRKEATTTSADVVAEIKVSYPGPRSNRNAREAVELRDLTTDQCEYWRKHFEKLGFVVERKYEKKRRPFARQSGVRGFSVTLEADEFSSNDCNGRVKNRRFLSISIETEPGKREEAEVVLDNMESDLVNAGAKIIRLDGNYEDYYYGEKELPKPCS